MTLSNRFEHIDELIAKVLCNEASAEEREIVSNWKAENGENALYFEEMELLLGHVASDFATPDFDVDRAWMKIEPAIKAKGRMVQMLPSVESVRRWRVAAAILVLIGLSSLAYFMFKSTDSNFAMKAGDSAISKQLPDGSLANLSKESSLSYEFDKSKGQRIAHLTGSCYFEVVHNEAESFIVETNDVFIRDIGTAFNVDANEKSDSIIVHVNEGEVAFFTKDNPGILLVAGETGVYSKQNKNFSKYSKEIIETPSPADREFKFSNAPMRKVLKRINDVYETKLELQNTSLEDCRITVNFMNDDIQTIANVIAETMGWTVEELSGKFVLRGKSCQ